MDPISEQWAQSASPELLLSRLRRKMNERPRWKDEMGLWINDVMVLFNALDQHMQDGHPLPSWWGINRRPTPEPTREPLRNPGYLPNGTGGTNIFDGDGPHRLKGCTLRWASRKAYAAAVFVCKTVELGTDYPTDQDAQQAIIVWYAGEGN